ncbi:hypothetical protein B0J15DRAFT_552827 [Fusarium solani]|uniref:Uncharacterized protein n=1 Tax=Fusarium solani TaxID=169388 RepID=A0A9P9GRR8_FUSSL|nr:uncharacterized protein B0J15DRAFT_552827 [Fusarium solani]KAH7243966.1 hypothetical protein B0J15DRAFT_552827 [Fusarium solani]
MATVDDAAAGEALPVEEHKSVWDKTERNFWTNLRRQREAENNMDEQEFQQSTTELRIKLRELTGQRSQLSESQARLARELAKVEAELARVTEECEVKTDRLKRIEQDYHESRQARIETQQKIWKTMRRFFKEKRGEDPNVEDSEDPDMEALGLPQELPELSNVSGNVPRREVADDSIQVRTYQSAAHKESMEGVEHHGNENAVDKPASDVIVDVVDADGNVIGPVERIEPWNQWVEGIQELEIRRPVKIRRGRRFNDSHLASIYERTEAKGVKWLSCMIQATGEIQSKRCWSCNKNQGAFDDCIIVGGDLFQRCGNCEWNRQRCHGASGDTIDILASRERSRQQREAKGSHTRPEPAPEPQPEQAPRTEEPVCVSSHHPSPQPVYQLVPLRLLNEVLSKLPNQLTGMPTSLLPHQSAALLPYPGPILLQSVWPEVPRSALPSHVPRPTRSGILQPTTEFDTPMKDMSAPNSTQPAQEPEQTPIPQEYRVTPRFTPANVRSRPPSAERAERPTPASMPIELSPQPTESPSEEPLEEITRDNLVLRHNGEVYTYPECVEGVPLVKINENHPYWEPNWPNVRTLIEPQLARWREKHQAAIDAGPKQEKGGSSKYQIGQLVNRGVKILEFHEQGPVSPYQLLSKKYIQSGKGGITSYDALFRLSETMSELEKFKLDIQPIEWMRQRLHELILAEGASFNLPRTIHDFYHDPKLTALRYKHGFKNIGRPSGLKARQSQGSPSDTPKPLKKRKSMHSVSSTSRETSFIDQSPLAAQVPMGPDSPSNTHLHKRPKCLSPASGPVHDEFHIDAWSDTDSHSGGEITKYDWRLYQVKNRLFTSSTAVTQYWTWIEQAGCFQHQVLKNVSPASWGLFKDHIDFHVNLDEIEEVIWNIEALRIHIIMRKVNVTMDKSDGAPRGDVMASFKRDRTMRRFLFFCREKGVRMLKQTTSEDHGSQVRLQQAIDAFQRKGNDVRSQEAGRIDAENDFTAPNPWLRRLGSALHLKDFSGKKDFLRDWISMEYEVDPNDPDESDDAQLRFIHIAFDRMVNHAKAVITPDTVSCDALFEVNRKELIKERSKPFHFRFKAEIQRRYTLIVRCMSFEDKADRPPFKLSRRQQNAYDIMMVHADDLTVAWKDHGGDPEVLEISRLLDLLESDVLELYISVLDHFTKDTEYDSVLVSFLTVLSVRADGTWEG